VDLGIPEIDLVELRSCKKRLGGVRWGRFDIVLKKRPSVVAELRLYNVIWEIPD
jgi:hypothetical protein